MKPWTSQRVPQRLTHSASQWLSAEHILPKCRLDSIRLCASDADSSGYTCTVGKELRVWLGRMAWGTQAQHL